METHNLLDPFAPVGGDGPNVPDSDPPIVVSGG